MQPMQHQMMGYDRAITMFSPDGRLLQVEYAKKTVSQGSTAIGLICSDGVLLVADKRIVDKLIIPDSVEKIFQIDDQGGEGVEYRHATTKHVILNPMLNSYIAKLHFRNYILGGCYDVHNR